MITGVCDDCGDALERGQTACSCREAIWVIDVVPTSPGMGRMGFWSLPLTRAAAFANLDACSRQTAYRYGPVRRVTDPPYEFPESIRTDGQHRVIDGQRRVAAALASKATPETTPDADRWGYWRKDPSGPTMWQEDHGDCSRAAAEALRPIWDGDGYTRGPVQRFTDPNPFEGKVVWPPAPSPATAVVTGLVPQRMGPWWHVTTQDGLAESLFATDDVVRKAISLGGDKSSLSEDELLSRAWARNEGGRRDWAIEIAKRVVERGKKP